MAGVASSGHSSAAARRGPRAAYLALDRVAHRATLGVLVVLMAVMFLTLLLGVVARYYRQTFVWSQEVAELAFVWTTFLGASAVYRERGHLGLELLGAVSARLDRWAGVAGMLLCAAFFGLMVITGVSYAASNLDQRSTVLHLPMGLVYLVVPLSGLLMLLHTGALALEGQASSVPAHEIQAV